MKVISICEERKLIEEETSESFWYLYCLRILFLYIMGGLYVAAGINHFVHPQMYLAIMPPWLPAHSFFVFLSGLVEVLLGLLLFIRRTRSVAAWGIIVLLMAVFPANLQMALNYGREDHPMLWLALLRLPLQLFLIWWAYQYTKVAGASKHK